MQRKWCASQPGCDPWCRMSPLALPGVRAPATCSALSTRICSSIWCPISWITVSTTWLAFWIRLTIVAVRTVVPDKSYIVVARVDVMMSVGNIGNTDNLQRFASGGW